MAQNAHCVQHSDGSYLTRIAIMDLLPASLKQFSRNVLVSVAERMRAEGKKSINWKLMVSVIEVVGHFLQLFLLS